MELDDLKYQLRKQLDSPQSKSTADLSMLLRKNTFSVIGKLKRSLWLEIIFSIFFALVFAYIGLFGTYRSLRIYFSVFSIFCILFTLLLGYFLTRTNQLSNTTLPVKKNMETIYSIIQGYTKKYFQFTLCLIPVCMIFAFWLGYNEPSDYLGEADVLLLNKTAITTNRLITFLGIYTIIISICVYYFSKWYFKKLYGQYLEELKKNIDELEN